MSEGSSGSWLGSYGDRQVVSAENGGFAYGVVNGDMHVFTHGGPVYLLFEYRSPDVARGSGVPAQPSSMLDARSQVVAFTGRAEELSRLSAWRDHDGKRLAASWLHGPGGQGKTRLAAQFASESAAAGWKVVTVTHGPGAVPPSPGSQDMSPGDAAGLLLIVDYADRWPLTHLTWLFSNRLFWERVPTRLLLLARSANSWSPVRSTLHGAFDVDTSSHPLQPIADDALGLREAMFVVARDCFAARYGVADPSAVAPPSRLHDPDFGLVLALHMAALVAVDAHVHGDRPPEDLAGLSSYLISREQRHWQQLFENGAGRAADGDAPALEYTTPRSVMHQVVFTATLTGATSFRTGKRVLGSLQLADPGRLLTDHGTCYPATVAGAVLEPPYPDRFAEELLALSFPGHPEYANTPWADDTAETVLQEASDGTPSPYTARALTFLTSAAAPRRWPHIASYLEDLLRERPALAVAAGGDVLAGLAGLDIDPEVLEAVEKCMPRHRRIDLDAGIAALGSRLAKHRLSRTDDPAEHGFVHRRLSVLMARAGRREDALKAAETAAGIHRGLMETGPATHAPELALSLVELADAQQALGRWRECLRTAEEAVRIHRGLPSAVLTKHAAVFARALCLLSDGLVGEERWQEATAAHEEAVATLRRPVSGRVVGDDPDLARALTGLSTLLHSVGRAVEGVSAVEEAAGTYERLARAHPGVYEPELALSLTNLGAGLHELDQKVKGLAVAEKAVAVHRQLATTSPASFEPSFAAALTNLSVHLDEAHRHTEALQAAEEAVEISRRLATAIPGVFEHDLANALTELSRRLADKGRFPEAIRANEEAHEIRRRTRSGRHGSDPRQTLRAAASAYSRLAAARRTSTRVWAADEHWVSLVAQDEMWQDFANRRHRLADMPPSYCRNVERFIRREPEAVIRTLLKAESIQIHDWQADDTPSTWLTRQPLLTALRRRARGLPVRPVLCHCGYAIEPGWDHDDCYPGIIVD
ncbi:tetratricopeptide repeat protein [Streptomyces sp. NPDC051217]|uniref:tetratricopeptide repeat protein n=1 Tax=Streptomyces sp. NPDC051217 TaxID=3365644 RepID=UPI0037B52333